ncbi:MAG: nucleotidyltransferase family protein [Pyrinomonadaceae bacterium]
MAATETIQESKITDDFKWNLLQKKMQEVQVLRVFSAFRAKNIDPILIKGLAAAQYYPEPGSRLSSDFDVAVPADDFEAATAVAVSPSANGIAVDVHRELRHLDTLEWDDLFENSRLLQVEGGEIRVLRPEDNLRVLSVHWLNDGGTDKEKLWDIYYAVKNRPPDFDWRRCLETVSKKRRRWITAAIGLAHRYLDLNLDDTPIKDEAVSLPKWLVREVEREWASGVQLMQVDFFLNDPAMLFAQIKKRLRPNSLQATIEMEGSFDARTRIYYQMGSFLKRTMPFFRRISYRIMPRSQ